MLKFKLMLQRFGEGGDGGASASSAGTGESGAGISGESNEDKILSSIPERARKYYKPVQQKQEVVQQPVEQAKAEEQMSYADLIKSEKYKDAHQEYMNKTIADRLKKFKGVEEQNNQYRGLLDVVAHKYGVDPSSENFLADLQQKIDADDSYYADYAIEHDMSTDEARRVVTMERKLKEAERQREENEKQERMREQIRVLQQNAERTKQQFPDFDLDTEMQDERFRRLCAVNNGDTTAAYMACHWNQIIPRTVQMATEQVKKQTAQAVASNKARPVENGMTSQSPSVVTTDFRNMSLDQLRAYAAEQRRQQKR